MYIVSAWVWHLHLAFGIHFNKQGVGAYRTFLKRSIDQQQVGRNAPPGNFVPQEFWRGGSCHMIGCKCQHWNNFLHQFLLHYAHFYLTCVRFFHPASLGLLMIETCALTLLARYSVIMPRSAKIMRCLDEVSERQLPYHYLPCSRSCRCEMPGISARRRHNGMVGNLSRPSGFSAQGVLR